MDLTTEREKIPLKGLFDKLCQANLEDGIIETKIPGDAEESTTHSREILSDVLVEGSLLTFVSKQGLRPTKNLFLMGDREDDSEEWWRSSDPFDVMFFPDDISGAELINGQVFVLKNQGFHKGLHDGTTLIFPKDTDPALMLQLSKQPWGEKAKQPA